MSSTVALLGPEAISGFKNDACLYDPRYGRIDCNDNDASTSTGFKIFDKILKKVLDISENHNVLVKLQIASCMLPEIASWCQVLLSLQKNIFFCVTQNVASRKFDFGWFLENVSRINEKYADANDARIDIIFAFISIRKKVCFISPWCCLITWSQNKVSAIVVDSRWHLLKRYSGIIFLIKIVFQFVAESDLFFVTDFCLFAAKFSIVRFAFLYHRFRQAAIVRNDIDIQSMTKSDAKNLSHKNINVVLQDAVFLASCVAVVFGPGR